MKTTLCALLLAACSMAARAPHAGSAGAEYHFDRNALGSAEATGESIIAVTFAGHLLRFDRSTLRLTGERFEALAVTAIGPAKGSGLLAGFADGSIRKLDPATLEATAQVGAVPGQLVWMGLCPGVASPLVLYAAKGRGTFGQRYVTAEDFRLRRLDDGADVALRASTVHCDSYGRLWAGNDSPIWVGTGNVAFVDLRASELRVTDIQPPARWERWRRVEGFVEEPDGSMLAYGGHAHLAQYTAFISRVRASGRAEEIYFNEKVSFDVPRNFPVPTEPIDQILRVGGRYLAFAGRSAYVSDDASSGWKKIGPEVPPLLSAWTDGNRVLLRTAGEGLAEWSVSRLVQHPLPGQPPWKVTSTRPCVGGVAAFDEGYLADVFVGFLRNGAWHPLQELLGTSDASSSTCLFRGDGRTIVIGTSGPRDGENPSRIDTVVFAADGRRSARQQRIEGGTWLEDAAEAFLLPDGAPALRGLDALWRFDGERWTSQPAKEHARHLVKWLFSPGGKHVSLEADERDARVLTHDGGPIVVRVEGHDRSPEDALFLDETHVLAATDGRLCKADLTTRECAVLPLEGDGEVHRLARDRDGRIWAAGRGLWLLDANLRATPCPLPFVFHTDVLDLEEIGGRLSLALGVRGIALFDPPRPSQATSCGITGFEER
jgi:hypothetical protein